jgi:hypothetical protein
MPVVTIHGINTRQNDRYSKAVDLRNVLINRLLLDPLSRQDPAFAGIPIFDVYWGDLGGNLTYASLPGYDGAAEASKEAHDEDLALTIASIAGIEAAPSRRETLGAAGNIFLEAARVDLGATLDAAFRAIIVDHVWDDTGLGLPTGAATGLLGVAMHDASRDPALHDALSVAAYTDADAVTLVTSNVADRLRELLAAEVPDAPRDREQLGSGRVDEAFLLRAKDAMRRLAYLPVRGAARTTVWLARKWVHRAIANGVGDLLIYFNQRGDREQPGPILERAISTIEDIRKRHSSEPLVFLTHSLGCAILYDILTFYCPDWSADVWICAGGQVGFIEELNLFISVDDANSSGEAGQRPRPNVTNWINVYDQVDTLAFLAKPHFDDAHDIHLSTGAGLIGSHLNYFMTTAFYDRVVEQILSTGEA